MGSYRIEFKRSAKRDLRGISPTIIGIVLSRVESLSDDPFPRQSPKLVGAKRTAHI